VALAARVDAAVKHLTDHLASAADRPVRIPLWGPWSLLLDYLLTTRMMELAVHSDDLAVSVGVATPALPQSARRHGDRLAVPPGRAPPRPDRRPAGPQPR
jgi:hypothetical protein